ncbi:MAG: hypothetical protein O3B24_06960 [Verrucomicrobia bacterium]|nr:hypothetical protein [Verrucomicrobiota bacterium]
MTAKGFSLARLLMLRTGQIILIVTLFDLIAVFFQWLLTCDILHARFFRLGRDRGFAEICQYLKMLLVIAMLVRWRKLRPARVLSAWILLFTVVLIDDSVGIHEEVGEWIEKTGFIPAVADIRTKDIAEMVSVALLEGLAMLYVIWNFIKAPPDLKRFSLLLLLAISPMIFSGGVLDLIGRPIIEDLGEMASATVLLWFMHRQYRKHVASADAGDGH